MAFALYAVLAVMALMGIYPVPVLDPVLLDPGLLVAVLLTFVELSVVTAIALFFSTFSTPMLSAALTFALAVAGRYSSELRDFDTVTDSRVAIWLTEALYWILPNFGPFDVRGQVVHGQGLPFGEFALSLTYGVVYASALLIAATFIFARRDFR
jgi:ABC-type transport system involved in multi-copper enzyme maturation permease subunit